MNQDSETPSNARVRIESLSYGPHGVARVDGKAVFVRGAAAREVADIEITEDHGRYAFARILDVVEASRDRRDPPCAFLPDCGGCPWQHVAYEAQLRAKEQNLRDALTRIARWPEAPVQPIFASPNELGYRARLRLRVEDRKIGFYAGGSHDLVAIDRCLIATDRVNEAMAAAADLVRTCREPIRRLEILTCEKASHTVLVGEIEGKQTPADGVVEAWRESWPEIAGVVLQGRAWRRAWGESAVWVQPEPNLLLQASAGAFTQVTPSGNRKLVQTVLELAELRGDETVLEIYAGIGNLTFPIARRAAAVTAVEQSGVSVDDAKANARRLQVDNVDFVQARAGNAMPGVKGPYDVVILDPPRSGAAEVLDTILAERPRTLVYVSCNPTTLARDLKKLRDDYTFDAIQPIDLFPQTYHVETVVRGRLRSRA